MRSVAHHARTRAGGALLVATVVGCSAAASTGADPQMPAPPPVAAAMCTTVNRPYGVQLGANVNALFWEEHYGDDRLLGAVRSLGRPVVRLPGGTEADYFDWELGRPVDACRYGSCRTWDSAQLMPPALFQRFGTFRNSTAGAFSAFARQVDGALLLVSNTVTASIDDNVRWVTAVRDAGSTVPMIELSNEPYFGRVEGTDNTERLYPTAASHVAFVRPLASALRMRVPAARLAFPAFVPRVDPATGQVSPGHDSRMLTWNEQSLATGIAGDVDAFALHFYPRLPGRAGAADPEYLQRLAAFAPAYWSLTIRQPQWSLLPAGKRLWITELNASFSDAPELVGSWMHGLMQAQLMLLMLQDSRVEVVLQHMLTGNAQWQAVVHPGRAPDIALAPGFTPYARTATGEVLAVLSNTLHGATCVQALPVGAAPTSVPGIVGVIARDRDRLRAVVVNASPDTITVDLVALGLAGATVTQHAAAPLSRTAAGSTVTTQALPVGSGGRTVRVGPHALVRVADGSP